MLLLDPTVLVTFLLVFKTARQVVQYYFKKIYGETAKLYFASSICDCMKILTGRNSSQSLP